MGGVQQICSTLVRHFDLGRDRPGYLGVPQKDCVMELILIYLIISVMITAIEMKNAPNYGT